MIVKLEKNLFTRNNNWEFSLTQSTFLVGWQRFSGSVNIYLKNVVEPLESYFCYYLKANIRHYAACSNCDHEGSNNAAKHCAANVTPCHNIDYSLRISVDGSDMMMAKKKILLLTYLILHKQDPD